LNNKKKALFYFLAIFPMLLWGIAYVWIKVVYKYYGPITTTFIRLLISGSLLMLIALIMRKRRAKSEARKQIKITRGDLVMFFLMTLVDPLGYFICESVGLTYVSALTGSIIISTIPLFSVATGYFLLKERLTILNISGAILSFSGIGIIILKPDLSFMASPFGVGLMFCAVFCAVAYSIIIKKLSGKYSALTIITVQNTAGAVYYLPLFLLFEYNNFIHVTPNAELIIHLLLLALLGSTIAFILYVITIEKIGIGKTNMFVNLIPVFTLIASYFILGEALTLKNVAGMVFVITGLYMSQIQKRKED
jgi:drug/metabolite transporter (DMT)-like permease